jgi:hypothetical protein
MLDMKRREFIALVGSGGLLAATNKCLAPSNKSRTGGKATQERERLKCSVGSNARDDRGLAVARHAVGPFPSDDHKNIFKQCHSAKGRIIVYDRSSSRFRTIQVCPKDLQAGQWQLVAGKPTALVRRPAGWSFPAGHRPIINMRQGDFIALFGGAPARPLATLVQELSTDRQEMP